MKRGWLLLLLSLILILALPVFADDNDFVVDENGVLLSYTGSGGDIIIPESIRDISANVFAGNSSITSATILNGVEAIATGAFDGCENLEWVELPSSIRWIGYYAFPYRTMIYTDSSTSYAAQWAIYNNYRLHVQGGSDFTVINGVLYSYLGEDADVNIPDTVTRITRDCFSGNTVMETVTIPDSVTQIGSQAFAGCTSLETVTIPDSVTEIGYGIFDGCSALESAVLSENISVLRSFTFRNCPNLTDLKLPDNLTQMGDYEFLNCQNLTELSLPSGLEKIGEGAFIRSGLTGVEIPAELTAISDKAFFECADLESVVIPNTVTSIGNAAFGGTSLAEVTIPASVTKIGAEAFDRTTVINAYKYSYAAGWAESNGNPSNILIPEYPVTDKFSLWIMEADGDYSNVTGQTIVLDLAGSNTVRLFAIQPDGEAEAVWNSSLPDVAAVENGLITGMTAGTATISATWNEQTVNVTIKVSSLVKPDSLGIEGPEEVLVSKTITLTPNFFQDPQPTDTGVTWTSSNSRIASVTSAGVVKGIKAGDAVIKACSKEDAAVCAEHEITVYAVSTAVSIRDGEGEDGTRVIDLTDLNDAYQLHASVSPAAAKQQVAWESDNEEVVLVDEDGLVTRVSGGTAVITAMTTDGLDKSSSVTITVGNKVWGPIAIERTDGAADDFETAVKKTMSLSAVFVQNTEPDNTEVIWTSSSARIAKVSADGVVTGVKAGTAVIKACSKENPAVCGEVNVRITTPAAGVNIIDLGDGSKVIDVSGAADKEYQLSAAVLPAAARQKVEWSSSAENIASVDENGLVTAYDEAGEAVITASATDGTNKSVSVTIRVGNKVQPGSLIVTAETDEVPVKKTLALSVAFDPEPDNTDVTWTSANVKFAKVSTDGVVTGIKGGTVEIKACSKENANVCGSFPVNVIPLATGVTIIDGGVRTGKVIDIATGDPDDLNYQLAAQVKPFTEGSAVNADQTVKWSSSNPAIASVDEDSGLVTAAGNKTGTVTITAKAQDGSRKTGTAKITVTALVQQADFSVIQADGLREVTKNKTLPLGVSFSSAIQPSNKAVTWSSSNKSVATVTTGGVVKGISAGDAVITATAKDASRAAAHYSITVLPLVSRIDLYDEEYGEDRCNDQTIGISMDSPEDRNLRTEVNEGADDRMTWKSSNTAVATVNDGVVHFMGKQGLVTITATAADGSKKSAGVKYNVARLVEEITVSGPETITAGKKGTFTVAVTPENATSKGVAWSVEDIFDDGSGSGRPLGLIKVSAAGVVSVNRSVAFEFGSSVCATAKDGSGVFGCVDFNVIPLVSWIDLHDNAYDEEMCNGQTIEIDLSDADDRDLWADVNEGADAEMTWKSSNTAVATVSEGRVHFAGKQGLVTITATAADGSGKSAWVKYHVVRLVEEITVSGPETITAGKTGTFRAEITPADAANKGVVWEVGEIYDEESGSSQPSGLINVSAAGVVTVSSSITEEFETYVCATAKDGSEVSDCKDFTVVPLVSWIDLYDHDYEWTCNYMVIGIDLDDPAPRSLYVEVNEGADPGMTWKSNNTAVASVDGNGNVNFTGKPGVVTITATATDGSKKSAWMQYSVGRPVEQITISGPETIHAGSTGTFTAAVLPENATNKSIFWEVGDIYDEESGNSEPSGLIKVSTTGVVTVSRSIPEEAEIQICAHAKDGSGVCDCTDFTVIPYVNWIALYDEAYEYEMCTGHTVGVDIESPEDRSLLVEVNYGANDEMTWKSSNEAVATVNGGTVHFTGNPGVVTITATATDGSKKSAWVKYNVARLVTEINVMGPDTVTIGGTGTFTAVVLPENASDKGVTWYVEDVYDWESEDSQPLGLITVSASGVVSVNSNAPEGFESSVCAYAKDGSCVENCKSFTLAAPSDGTSSLPDNASELNGFKTAEQEAPNNSDLTAGSEIVSGLHFAKEELTLSVGESLSLEVLNPDDEAYVIALSDSTAAALDAEAGMVTGLAEGEITAFLADAAAVEITDQMVIRVLAEAPQNEAESTADAAEETAETTEPITVGNQETVGDSVSFGQGSLEMTLNETRYLSYDAEGKIFYGSNDLTVAAVDPESGFIMAVGTGETMVYAASVDPMEIKALMTVTVKETETEMPAETAELEKPETSETPAEESAEAPAEEIPAAEGSEAASAAPEAQAQEVPAAEEAETETGGAEETASEPAETPTENAVEPEGQPEMAAEIGEVPAEEQPAETPAEAPEIELTIRDLTEAGWRGIEGTVLKIERDRFSVTDEELRTLVFKSENEWVVKPAERSMDEILTQGIELNLLSAGETKLKIGLEGEEPLLTVRVVVEAAPVAEEAEPAAVPAAEPLAAEAVVEAPPYNEPATAEEPAAEPEPEPAPAEAPAEAPLYNEPVPAEEPAVESEPEPAAAEAPAEEDSAAAE